MRLTLLASLVLTACASAQTPTTTKPAAFDGARAFKDLTQIVAIGPRPAGSEGAQKTRDYIKQQLAAIGVEVVEESFDQETPAGTVRMVNVSATLPGTG